MAYPLKGECRNTGRTHFGNGHTPWNKGVKTGIVSGGGFKKGQPGYWTGKKRPPSWNKGLKGYKAGENHYNWKGGITPTNHRVRTSTAYMEWRRHVFQRDDYTCQACGKRGGKLHADHVLRFSRYIDLRTEILNGRTLCVMCHKKTPTYSSSTYDAD